MQKAPIQANRYPTSFQAVDVVIRDLGNHLILLGRKKRKRKFRLPGGFVDPKDASLENAAIREAIEECDKKKNLTLFSPQYVDSFRIDDPRYRKSRDKIMSAVFSMDYMDGTPEADDDLVRVQWFEYGALRQNYKKCVVKEHWPIVEVLMEKGLI